MLDATFLFFCILFFVFYSLGMYLLGKLSVDDKQAYQEGYNDGWYDTQQEIDTDKFYAEGFRDGYLTAKRGTVNLDELFSKYDEVDN